MLMVAALVRCSKACSGRDESRKTRPSATRISELFGRRSVAEIPAAIASSNIRCRESAATRHAAGRSSLGASCSIRKNTCAASAALYVTSSTRPCAIVMSTLSGKREAASRAVASASGISCRRRCSLIWRASSTSPGLVGIAASTTQDPLLNLAV
jgi:hypothetical protein